MLMSSTRDNIKLLILESGEHVIGFCDTVDGGHEIKVTRPVSLVPKPDGTGIVFIPYLQFTEIDVISFKNSSLRHDLIEPKVDLADHYYKQFGSGIILPPKAGNIIGI